ncbi:DoxX family protein [Sciscionella marina]|uniref:DoxX family protein n=1 Tax=Sciscionella marina TaxID=508770 RepID=UPI001F099F96|nr:DoxX family protein [Sciscionella marina]
MSLLHRAQSPVYVLFRVIVGLMFACHGLHKLFGFFAGAGPLPMVGEWPDWWAAVIELAGGLLVAFGLATRFAAIICAGAMAYAYFVVHQPGGHCPSRTTVNPRSSTAGRCW